MASFEFFNNLRERRNVGLKDANLCEKLDFTEYSLENLVISVCMLKINHRGP